MQHAHYHTDFGSVMLSVAMVINGCAFLPVLANDLTGHSKSGSNVQSLDASLKLVRKNDKWYLYISVVNTSSEIIQVAADPERVAITDLRSGKSVDILKQHEARFVQLSPDHGLIWMLPIETVVSPSEYRLKAWLPTAVQSFSPIARKALLKANQMQSSDEDE